MMRHGRRYFVISPGSIPLNIKVSRDVVFTLQKKLFILTVVRGYIRCEMTPTSVGGEQQNYISGGIQSPIWYSLRQDCRDAQKNMSCIAWRASRSKNAEGILELVIDMTTQSGTAEISPLLSKWIAEAFFIYTKYKRKKRTRLWVES